jgi:hypothetical protein
LVVSLLALLGNHVNFSIKYPLSLSFTHPSPVIVTVHQRHLLLLHLPPSSSVAFISNSEQFLRGVCDH